MKREKYFPSLVLGILGLIIVSMVGYAVFINGIRRDVTTAISDTVTLSDKSNLYTIQIPANWQILTYEGARGNSLSEISGRSPDWRSHSGKTVEHPCTPVYYDSGVLFQFGAAKQEGVPAHYGEGGGPFTGVLYSEEILIDGAKGTYHVFTEPCTDGGQLVDVHVNYKENGYIFRFAYNPVQFPQAESVFRRIMHSIRFQK